MSLDLFREVLNGAEMEAFGEGFGISITSLLEGILICDGVKEYIN